APIRVESRASAARRLPTPPDRRPTPEVENTPPPEPSPAEREQAEHQAAKDEQRRREDQRLVEQIEAVKAHGRHHARRLGVGTVRVVPWWSAPCDPRLPSDRPSWSSAF